MKTNNIYREVVKAKRSAKRTASTITKLVKSIETAKERQAKELAKAEKAIARYEARRAKLYKKLYDITEFEAHGGRFEANTRAKLARIQRALDAKPADLTSINKRLNEVAKEANKTVRKAKAQHNLIEKRIAEAQEIMEAGGTLAPDYKRRLEYVKELHEANRTALIPDNIINYMRNQRKGQVLRAKGASIGSVKITSAISASGNVRTYNEETGKFYDPSRSGTIIGTLSAEARMDMEKGFIIPIRYKQTERQAVAEYISKKLEGMKASKAKGEEVLTGKVLDNALIFLNDAGILKYDTDKGIESLKFNPKNIDKAVESGYVDPDSIDEVLYSLAGYERFSKEAEKAVDEQMIFNSQKMRGMEFKKFAKGAINDLLRGSAIWNKFHPYAKGESPKGSGEEQDEMDEVIGKAREIEDYFPQSFVDFTYDVAEANERRGRKGQGRGFTPLADKWVEIMLYIYSQIDDLERGTITERDLEKEVNKRIPR